MPLPKYAATCDSNYAGRHLLSADKSHFVGATVVGGDWRADLPLTFSGLNDREYSGGSSSPLRGVRLASGFGDSPRAAAWWITQHKCVFDLSSSALISFCNCVTTNRRGALSPVIPGYRCPVSFRRTLGSDRSGRHFALRAGRPRNRSESNVRQMLKSAHRIAGVRLIVPHREHERLPLAHGCGLSR